MLACTMQSNFSDRAMTSQNVFATKVPGRVIRSLDGLSTIFGGCRHQKAKQAEQIAHRADHKVSVHMDANRVALQVPTAWPIYCSATPTTSPQCTHPAATVKPRRWPTCSAARHAARAMRSSCPRASIRAINLCSSAAISLASCTLPFHCCFRRSCELSTAERVCKCGGK